MIDLKDIKEGVPGLFANLIKSKGGDLLNGLSNLIKDWKVTPEQQAQISAEVNRHLEEQTRLAQQADALYISDIHSARSLQIEALKQNDNFSKRFIYWLAAGIILLTFAFDFCISFFTVSPENKDVVNVVTGALNITCLGAVISFFYGSSKSSSDKQTMIENLTGANKQ